jgi:hypothetical protein
MIHHLSTVCGAFLRGGDPEPITMTIRPALVKAFLEEWEDPS